MKTTEIKPIKGYGQVQTEVMTSRELSINAKALYAYYCSVQGGKDYSWKANDTIMDELGMSDKTFKKAKAELVAMDLITSTKRKDTSTFVSVKYVETSIESTTLPTYGKQMVGDNEEVIENTSANTDKQWQGVEFTPHVEGKNYPTNINNININNTNKENTNENACASSASEIFSFLKDLNVEELGYAEAANWRMNDQDVKNIEEDIENLGKEVVINYIEQHIKNHAHNMKKGTTRYTNVSYSAIHNNVRDNKWRD